MNASPSVHIGHSTVGPDGVLLSAPGPYPVEHRHRDGMAWRGEAFFTGVGTVRVER